jgi:hypothetical protein
MVAANAPGEDTSDRSELEYAMETRVSSYNRGDLLLCARAELNTSGQSIADEFTIAPAEGPTRLWSEVGNTCDHTIRKLNRQLAKIIESRGCRESQHFNFRLLLAVQPRAAQMAGLKDELLTQ